MEQFEAGDLVEIPGIGPLMRLVSIDCVHEGENHWQCVWFTHQGQFAARVFPESWLILVEKCGKI